MKMESMSDKQICEWLAVGKKKVPSVAACILMLIRSAHSIAISSTVFDWVVLKWLVLFFKLWENCHSLNEWIWITIMKWAIRYGLYLWIVNVYLNHFSPSLFPCLVFYWNKCFFSFHFVSSSEYWVSAFAIGISAVVGFSLFIESSSRYFFFPRS